MAHNKRRSFLLFLSTIAICAVVGGVYGPRVEVASAATDEDSIRASFKTFTKVYSLVEDNFADPVNPDKAIYKAPFPECCGPSIRTRILRSPRFPDFARGPEGPLLRCRNDRAAAQRQDHRAGAVQRLARV